MSEKNRSISRNMNKKTATRLGVVIIGVVIFALPIIPVSYRIPYREEVPILRLIGQTRVFVNSTDVHLEGGAYKFWNRQIDDYKRVDFSLRASETVHAAIMSPEEFEAFQGTLSIDQSPTSILESSSIDLEYQIPVTETYFFVIHNHHDGNQGAKKETTIYSVTITESWEEEALEYKIKEGIRNETAMVTLWQLITGSTPVY